MSEADRARWDRRWGSGEPAGGTAPRWLDRVAGLLPDAGRALDVAAGAGRIALWLAARGLHTSAVDISPLALERLESAAAARGLALQTRALDLEIDPLPPGPFDAISCFDYLQRDLFAAMAERLAPGGVLIAEAATRRNLERHARPSARFLLEPGELLRLVTPLRLEVEVYREGWIDDRCVARILARKPAL
jgi:SAM-dependent methyltransferase